LIIGLDYFVGIGLLEVGEQEVEGGGYDWGMGE